MASNLKYIAGCLHSGMLEGLLFKIGMFYRGCMLPKQLTEEIIVKAIVGCLELVIHSP